MAAFGELADVGIRTTKVGDRLTVQRGNIKLVGDVILKRHGVTVLGDPELLALTPSVQAVTPVEVADKIVRIGFLLDEPTPIELDINGKMPEPNPAMEVMELRDQQPPVIAGQLDFNY